MFSIIIFGSITSQGWGYDGSEEVCIINQSYSTCQLATAVGILAFVIALGRNTGASLGPTDVIILVILTGEYYYEEMESGATRKQFIIADLAFSGEISRFTSYHD